MLCEPRLMTNDLRCPACGGTLTLDEHGQTEQLVWLRETWREHAFIVNRPFAACDACEWVFDGRVQA